MLWFVFLVIFFFLMIRRPPRSTRTDTLFPYTTLFRSQLRGRQNESDAHSDCEGRRIWICHVTDKNKDAGGSEHGRCPTLIAVRNKAGTSKRKKGAAHPKDDVADVFHRDISDFLTLSMANFRSEKRRVGKVCVINCRTG